MKLKTILIGTLLAWPMSGMASAGPFDPGPLWHDGQNTAQTVYCTKGCDCDPQKCLALQVQSAKGPSMLGQGYIQVKVLWAKKPGEAGPDLILLGGYGGSGGNSDLFAVRFSPELSVRKVNAELKTEITVSDPDNHPRFNWPFAFNDFGSAHAAYTVVPLPIDSASGDFVLDYPALVSRSFSDNDLDFRELAIQEELSRWARDSYPATSLAPGPMSYGLPVTANALGDLMLSGHADIARRILHEAWPRDREHMDVAMGGEDHLWAELCRKLVRGEQWRQFDLDRLPHADMIQVAAKSSD